jgi:DNA-directed RNA polymerase specialized sigma24 family protein
MLEILAKRNEDWRNLAYRICGDYDLAQDLVQQMYIRLKDYKEVNEAMVAITIKNLWTNILKKKNREVSIELFHSLEYGNENFEPDDKELEYLNRFEALPMVQQELIQESFDKSVRKIGKDFNINYGYVHKKIHEGLKEILKDDYNLYKNSNLKYLKTKKKMTTKKDLDEYKGDKRSREYRYMRLEYDKSIETKNVDDVGIGTKIEKVLKATGVSNLVKIFTPDGEDCGCNERKRKLNNSPLFNSAQKPKRCLTKQMFEAYDYFFKTREVDKWSAEESKLVFNTYEWVFALRYDTKRMCANCNGTANILRMITSSLDKVYSSY